MNKELYYGIDFHKNTSTIYTMLHDGEEFEPIRTVRTVNLVQYLSNRPIGHIAIEATGGSNEMAKRIRKLGHKVSLVETNVSSQKVEVKMAKSLSNQNKRQLRCISMLVPSTF